MQKEQFEIWTLKNKISVKMVSDHISRIQRLEKVFREIYGSSFSFEKSFAKDQCASLFFLLRRKGINPELQRYKNVDLPIGKNTMGSIRYSLRTYCRFLLSKN